MLRSLARNLGLMALATAFGAGLSAGANAESGFLKDYSQLKTEKDPLGIERRIWVSPKFTGDKYQKILVEKVVFYPEAEASDGVPSKTLTELIPGGENKAWRKVAGVASCPGVRTGVRAALTVLT